MVQREPGLGAPLGRSVRAGPGGRTPARRGKGASGSNGVEPLRALVAARADGPIRGVARRLRPQAPAPFRRPDRPFPLAAANNRPLPPGTPWRTCLPPPRGRAVRCASPGAAALPSVVGAACRSPSARPPRRGHPAPPWRLAQGRRNASPGPGPPRPARGATIGRRSAARASDADLGSRGPGSRRRRFASWSPPRTARIMVLEERCCFFTVSLRWKCTPTESSRRGVPRLPSTTPPALAAAVAQSSAAHRRQPQRAVVRTPASDPRSRLGARVKNLVPGRVPDARPAPGHVIRMCIPFWVTARRLPP